jgi:class I fructose-bisphosphate aldolase
MGLGKQVRLNRLFSHPSGRLCSVAVDHFVGYSDHLPEGLANLPRTLAQIVAARPDAVTMTKGTALTCWLPHAGKTPMILQAACFTVDERINEVITNPEECIRCGADALAVAICVRGLSEGAFIKKLSDAVTAAAKYDLPVVAHIYPKTFGPEGTKIVHDADNIFWATRVGIECGADVIKVGYTGDPVSFAQIVSSCPVPVVAAGGPKNETLEEALTLMEGVVKSGARGATIGRNIWGHSDIGEALRAFKAVIHDGLGPVDAIAAARGQKG